MITLIAGEASTAEKNSGQCKGERLMKRALLCIVAFFCMAQAHAGISAWSSIPSPTGNTLNSVIVISANDAFAAGDAGTILQFDGVQWSVARSPTGNNLNSVWGSDANNVFAAGDKGTILQFDGTSWSTVQSATGSALYGIWGSAADNVFAVGAAGTILKFDGVQWSAVQSATGNTLRSIWGSSAGNIFAVGEFGTIIHFDGTSWSNFQSATGNPLYGIWGDSPNDFVAVGAAGTILQFNGVQWSAIQSPAGQKLNSVWGTAADNIFAVGDQGATLQFDGVSWSSIQSATGNALRGVSGSDAAGSAFSVGMFGVIMEASTGPTSAPSSTPVPAGGSTAVPSASPTAVEKTRPTVSPTTAEQAPQRTPTQSPQNQSVSGGPSTGTLPTPTPVKTAVSGTIRNSAGSPVSGVLVLSRRLGSTVTDENGRFRFQNASRGRSYLLVFNREDMTFIPPSIRTSAGSISNILAVPGDIHTQGCSMENAATKHAEIDAEAMALLHAGSKAALRLRKMVHAADSRRLKVLGRKYESSLDSEFANAIDQSLKLPVLIVTCPAGASCIVMNSRAVINTYMSILKKMARIGSKAARAAGTPAGTTRHLSRGIAALKTFPLQTAQCM